MSKISIIDIPVETLSKGLNPTRVDNDTITYHSYSTPNFSENSKDILTHYELPLEKYYLNYQKSNRGKSNGKNWKCRNCKLEIEIGQPMIRLTEKDEIEYNYGQDRGIRPIFKSFIFGNEECMRTWLNENNPAMMI
jgi:hypothetical protein